MPLAVLPTVLVGEILSHLTAPEMAVAVRASRSLADAAHEAFIARAAACALPRQPNVVPVTAARASALLRMSELLATPSGRLSTAAVGLTHQLRIVGGRTHESGHDPDVEPEAAAARSVVVSPVRHVAALPFADRPQRSARERLFESPP